MTEKVLLVACSADLAHRVQAVSETQVQRVDDVEAGVTIARRDPSGVAAVALGREVTSPVAAVQSFGTVDAQLAVVVLSDDLSVGDVTRDLQFAPFIGEDVVCRSDTYLDAAGSAVAAAAERTLRRRAHRVTMRAAAAQLGPTPQFGRAAATTESLGTLLDQAPVGIVTLDDRAYVVSLNRHAERLLESRQGDVVRQPFVDLFPDDARARLSVMLMPGGPLAPSATRRFRRARSDGRVQDVDITAARFHSSLGRHGTILLVQEVTEAATAERERHHQARALQEGVIQTLTAAQAAAADGDAARAEKLIGHALERSEALASQLLVDARAAVVP